MHVRFPMLDKTRTRQQAQKYMFSKGRCPESEVELADTMVPSIKDSAQKYREQQRSKHKDTVCVSVYDNSTSMRKGAQCVSN